MKTYEGCPPPTQRKNSFIFPRMALWNLLPHSAWGLGSVSSQDGANLMVSREVPGTLHLVSMMTVDFIDNKSKEEIFILHSVCVKNFTSFTLI